MIGYPTCRKKLDFGDYSAKITLPNAEFFDFSSLFSIERKMSIGELCQCYCSGRDRFRREFDRAKACHAKLYLLIEDASWNKVFTGYYNSRMRPKALLASIFAWLARYNCQLIFCSPEQSGRLIKEIIYREVKEYLENHA